jgi:hypothetical protein
LRSSPVGLVGREIAIRLAVEGRGQPGERTGIRSHAAEWEVSVTVELLDAKGALIDRFSGSESLEAEAKNFYVEHPVLTYVLPSIAKATVRLQAKRD